MSRQKPFPLHATIGEKYDPAMEIQDQAEADAYFERLVNHAMRFVRTREEAERIERQNLGYYAGYCSDDTRERVERLFKCHHPFFGPIAEVRPPRPEEAFEIGKALGYAMREGNS